MVFGMNGNGEGRTKLIESAANSAAFTVIARVSIIALGVLATIFTGVVVPRTLSYFAAQEAVDTEQNRLLGQLSATQQLIVYRLGQAEELNRDQEEHFRASDGRINRLERVVPEPMRPPPGLPDWQSKDLFR